MFCLRKLTKFYHYYYHHHYYYYIHHSNLGGIFLLSMGQKIGLPKFVMHFTSFKVCCHNIFKRQIFNVTFLDRDSSLNYILDKYFSTQTSLLCSSPFKRIHVFRVTRPYLEKGDRL